MKRTMAAMLATGLALFLVGGCGGKGSGGKGSGGSGSKALTKEDKADQRLGEKLTAYVELGNKFTDRVYSSRRRYHSWLKDPQTGPTCKERHLYGLYKISKTGKTAEKVQKAAEMKPSMKKLEGAAAKVLAALDKLEPLINKASRYYAQKDYKDDKCKKGQTMHAELEALFEEFAANETILSAIVFKTSRALHERLLARIEKEYGKDHQRYYHKKLSLDARTLLKMLAEGKAEAATAGKAVSAFDKLIQEADANAKKGKSPSGYDSFRREANKFVKACKERVRRVKSGKGYSKWDKRSIKGGSGWMVKGSYAKCVRNFNSLIAAANRVR